MNRKTKRILVKILILLGIVITMLGLVQCTVGRIQYIRSGLWQYEIDGFKKNYKKSFEIVSEKFYEIYCEEREKNNIEELRVLDLSLDEWRMECVVGEKESYPIVIELSEELNQATKKVLEAFSQVYPGAYGEGQQLEARENRVAFYAGNVSYVVIHTMDSSRPKYLQSPDEEGKVYIKRITRGWYHGTKTE